MKVWYINRLGLRLRQVTRYATDDLTLFSECLYQVPRAPRWNENKFLLFFKSDVVNLM